MGVIRTCALLGIASTLIAACSDRGVVSGVFNNQPSYEAAMREHDAAWRSEIGDAVTRPKLAALMRAAGGQCFLEEKLTICVVNVEARRPRLFTTRHMWRVEFSSTDKDKLERARSHVDILGWDL